MPRPRHDTEELVTALGLLVRRLRAERAAHDLGWTEAAVIGRLGRGGASTIAELARLENVKPQSMGATIAALEEAGLVQRKPHPSDRRQALIELSEAGVALRKNVREAKRAWLQQAIGRLDPTERDTLFAAAEIMARLAQS
jgi:DNA-binding MarR family transcriptional regulator